MLATSAEACATVLGAMAGFDRRDSTSADRPAEDDEKIGLLYWLGRALEAEGRAHEAQPYYRRALAVDIHFMDLAERLRAISKGGTP